MHTGTGKYMAAVGMFDGLHTGHRFVLGELRRHAAMRGMQPMVITFANHPSDILRPDNMPHLLMSAETKRRAISDLTGIQTVEVLQFTAEFAAMTAQEFLNKLKSRGVAALVMGFNNHIGSDRLDAKQAKGLGIIDIEELQACPGDENASSSCCEKLCRRPISLLQRLCSATTSRLKAAWFTAANLGAPSVFRLQTYSPTSPSANFCPPMAYMPPT